MKLKEYFLRNCSLMEKFFVSFLLFLYSVLFIEVTVGSLDLIYSVKFGTRILNKMCTLSYNAMRLELWTKYTF